MRKLIILSILIISLIATPIADATSNYVLPYPSSMPGSIFYKLNLLKEEILRFWYFGDFGQFTYSLKESDKYLVEAKTLYEYNQYLLATDALRKSDKFLKETSKSLESAKKANKNIESSRALLRQACLKHIEVLEKLEKDLPEAIEWKPENANSQVINIKRDIQNSIAIRQRFL